MQLIMGLPSVALMMTVLPLVFTRPKISSALLLLSTFTFIFWAPSSLPKTSSLFTIDHMSFLLIELTLWISGLMFMANRKIVSAPFSMITVSLALTLIFCFASSNLLRFYIFFETSLIPTLAMILIWGYQPERLQATLYLVMYTITSALSLLLFIFFYQNQLNSSFMFKYYTSPIIPLFVSVILILPFLVKIPMYSLHLWLPKAHVEAPVAGSMILAAILLKLGGYGLIRLSMLTYFTSYIYITPLAIAGAALTSIICLNQTDIKSLIAYSSVAHMGLLISAGLTSSFLGFSASIMIMLAHGLASSALFVLANISYESTNSRALILSKGLLTFSPSLTFLWFCASFANMSGPPSLNFFGELLALPPTLAFYAPILCLPLIILLFFSGAYSLFLYTSISHGSTPFHAFLPNKGRNFLTLLLHIAPLFIMPLKLTFAFFF